MIQKEESNKKVIKAKGVLVGVDDSGMHIEDEKSGTVSTLSFDTFKMFVGESFKFSMNREEKAIEQLSK